MVVKKIIPPEKIESPITETEIEIKGDKKEVGIDKKETKETEKKEKETKKENIDGMLVYGVNSCGKSSLMKSLGVNLVLAQAGMYVAADTFDYYPYQYNLNTYYWQ